jgi:DNA repair exonuclease SbcCD ATPase subunit
MQILFIRYGAFLLAGLITLSLFSIDADAQRRRNRRVRRAPRPVVTNPDIAPPGSESVGPDGERIISTADESTTESTATPQSPEAKKEATERDMERTINALSNQLDRLNNKLSKMEENDRSLIDMERLTRAEQRAENLRMQQVDVESKLADLQSRLEQTEYAIKPENIERSNAGYGSVRPEEARDTRRRQLESERTRLQAQIRILETSRTRLEQALATADAEVDLLRRRLEQNRQQQESTEAIQPEPRPIRPE